MHIAWSSSAVARRDKRQILIGVAVFVAVALVARLFYLQVLNSEEYRATAQSNFLRLEVIPAMRGIIRDRHGEVLASSVPAFSVSLDPFHEAFRGDRARRIKPRARLEDVVDRLAPILGMDAATLLPSIRKAMKSSYQPLRLKRNVDMKTLSVIAERRAELPGVLVDADPMRLYPHGQVGAHVIGYISEISDDDLTRLRDQGYFPGASVGRAGVERTYENMLRGQDGIRYVEVNALGRRSNQFVSMPPILPHRGRDLTLTIDWKLQEAAEAALDSSGWSGPGRPPETRGACVALDVRTGEVLALASRPAYDPNAFAAGFSHEEWDKLNAPGRFPLLNRAIQSLYPPGSTFKPITLIAGLVAHKVGPGSSLGPCVGGWNFGGRFFRCWSHAGHGMTSAIRAIAVSCDVYFYQLGNMLGVDGISEMAHLMRVPDKTGIDLPQEKAGQIPDSKYMDKRYGPGNWSRGAALNMAIGQGEDLLTPVEMASMAATLATGRVPRVHVVQSVSQAVDEKPVRIDTSPRAVVEVAPSAMAVARLGMEAVVAGGEGTGHGARIDSVEVAGKSGSAQNAGKLTHALFVCYAPADDPQIAVAVILEERGHGGTWAAPVARAVLDHYFHPEHYLPKPDSLMADSTVALAAVVGRKHPLAPVPVLSDSARAAADSLAGD